MDYRVELDVYNGPLDLLLYLLKRDELNIYDIPIARITDSYMAYVKVLREASAAGLDINVAGDFLVMAATLMEIKSAMLLPRAAAVEAAEPGSAAADLADPRHELVQQLLEYKRFKDAAGALEERQREHQSRFARVPGLAAGAADEPPPVDLDEVQVWDLLSAFDRLMKEVGTRKTTHDVVYDDTPIDLHAADIEDRLRREKRLTLRQLLVGRGSRSEMVGVFLALLELIREKKIMAAQNEAGELEITEADEAHKKTYRGASLHLTDEADMEEPLEYKVPTVSAEVEDENALIVDEVAEVDDDEKDGEEKQTPDAASSDGATEAAEPGAAGDGGGGAQVADDAADAPAPGQVTIETFVGRRGSARRIRRRTPLPQEMPPGEEGREDGIEDRQAGDADN